MLSAYHFLSGWSEAAFGIMSGGGGPVMPIHDWTRVPAGLFHHFHQDWSIEIARELNRGRLPHGLSALVEQRSGPVESDVLAIENTGGVTRFGLDPGGATATAEPPVTRLVRR